MSAGWQDRLHRRLTLGEAAIWTAAGLLVTSVCATAAILHPPALEKAGENAPQAAIMIELAPEPEAVETERNDITEDRVDAAERPVETQEPLPLPEPPAAIEAKAPPPPAPQPVLPQEVRPEQPPVPVADSVEQQMLALLENVEVPLPVARPKPPLPEKPKAERPKADPPEKSVVRKKPKTEAPSVAARKPAATVKTADRNAATKTVASSAAAKGDATRWKARVVAHLERRKRYPQAARARGEEGTVLVVFRIDPGGRVLSTSLARSSGHSALDEAAVAMVERASPVPAPPPGASTTITAPVRFVRR
ncbi:energy transducer TonB [Gellertiella hungarica]|uniref:Protein TonB n=1 Tax=Gellertiella hungarica TaxID=1572859 RepID=A0A7W6NL12_9HYPH|nr:energy transducer TonB [Gellertiella hungarica]MBB4066050.1 protein TonB [Gellertiella hungarica]